MRHIPGQRISTLAKSIATVVAGSWTMTRSPSVTRLRSGAGGIPWRRAERLRPSTGDVDAELDHFSHAGSHASLPQPGSSVAKRTISFFVFLLARCFPPGFFCLSIGRSASRQTTAV
jgi:hypothetical protein